MNDPEDRPAAAGWPRRIGAVLQGIILGVLTAFALFNLIELSSGAQIFRYQGF